MSEKEKTFSESGRFIVADILPPRHPVVHAAAVRSSMRKKPKSSRETKKELPERKEVGSEERPIDKWFRKEQETREQSAAKHTPTSFRVRLWKKKKFTISLLAVLLVAAGVGGYGISYALSRLEVDVSLKTELQELNFKLFVAAEPASADMLAGERIDFSDSGTEAFKATGTDDVRSKAKGVVSIYNAFNSIPQNLVANTRFEASDGKIYRIREAVTIPAAVMENGALSPRSVNATVYADQPGPEYNRESGDLAIPGFKGSPRFKGFYARVKTPIEGGYIGTATIVTKKDLDAAGESLESHMRSRVIQKAKESVPEGFWLLEDATEVTVDNRTFSHEAGDVTEEFSGSIGIQVRAIIFRRDEFIHMVIKKAGFDPAAVSIRNLDELSVAVDLRNMETGNLTLKIQDSAVFVRNLEMARLAEDLAREKDPRMFNAVFQKHEAVQRADVRFIPSWVRRVPSDPTAITIRIVD